MNGGKVFDVCYNLSKRIRYKYRIDKKIVIVESMCEPVVLGQIETRLILAFNGGSTLNTIAAHRTWNPKVLESFNWLIDKGYLVETEERYRQELTPEWTLDEVFFELSKKCNLHCRHCYIPDDIDKHDLTLEEWKVLIDACKDKGVNLIKLTGGEPMLSPVFWNVAEYIHEKGIRIRLYTNGSFLNEDTIKRLKQLGVMECQISLDGGTRETHNSFRRAKKSFEVIMAALPVLQQYKMKVILSYTLSDYNQREVKAFIDLAYQFPNVKVVVSPYINYHQTSEKKCELNVNQTMIEELRELFHENVAKWSDKTNYYHTFSNRYIGYCGVGLYMLYIDSSGRVMLCPLLNQEENIIGNVREHSLSWIWEHSELLNEYRKQTIQDIQGCNNCLNVNACRGGCRARAFLKSGKLLHKDEISCQMY